MKKAQKAIYVHKDAFNLLEQAKIHLQGLTNTRMSWTTFLYMLAAGALAMASLQGLTLSCPECGHTSELYYKMAPEEQEKPTA